MGARRKRPERVGKLPEEGAVVAVAPDARVCARVGAGTGEQLPAAVHVHITASGAASISADGAYDTEGTYEAAYAQGEGQHVRVVISPRHNAQLSPRPSVALQERNRNIRSIHRLGRRQWYKWSGYSKRSVVENTIYRYKRIIGRGMRSRTLAGQRVEVQLACRVLNRMTHLGMPDSYRVG